MDRAGSATAPATTLNSQSSSESPSHQSVSSFFGCSSVPKTVVWVLLILEHSEASRHSEILGGSQEVDVGGYRAAQYSSVYGSTALSSAHQVPSLSAKGAAPSTRGGRQHYGERQSVYIGRDLPSNPTGRYAADPVGSSHQHQQPEIYDPIDQAALLRREKLLKTQSLQAASLDGGTRQADYLAARAAASRHSTQDLMSYGGRLYFQSASKPGYGVSMPPGRDYASGKGLHGNAMVLDYPGDVLSRGGHNDRKDDQASYLREFELREDECRWERLCERDRDGEREKEWERERERILKWRKKEWERVCKRALETSLKQTPVRSSKDPRGTISKDFRGSSLTKEGRSSRLDSPHHGTLHSWILMIFYFCFLLWF